MASLGTILVAFATVDLSPAIRAAHRQGIPGVVVPTDENCASGSYGAQECSSGNFVSNDGRIRLQDVDISDEVDKVGKPQDALYVSGGLGTTVYPPHGSLAWVFDVWCIMFGAGAWWAAIYLPVKFWSKRSSAKRNPPAK